MILVIAEKYGQAPQDVESWDQYWLERAALKVEAESIRDSRTRTKNAPKRR
jgi:hypothetical protein